METPNQLYAHQQNTPTQTANSNGHDNVEQPSFKKNPAPTTTTTTAAAADDDVRSTRKKRIKSSRLMEGSRVGGPLDDPNFAPPPLLPADDETLKSAYSLNAKCEADYENLPRYDKIKHSGTIMTRFSAIALLTKKWSQNFWILYANCLYFFRSRDDFEEWLLNPYLSKAQRDNLVKLYLKFDSTDTKHYYMDKTRMKYYRKDGMMHHFKLNKLSLRGNAASLNLVGAFSSMNEKNVIELRTIIDIILKKKPKHTTLHFGINSDAQSACSNDFALTDGNKSTVSAGF
jgi:hypothetical protein